MKKLAKISAGVMVVALLTMSSAQAVFAQTASTTTATSTLVAQVSSLLQQIKTLQDRLASLQREQGQVVTQLRNTLQLTRQLRVGMSGNDVKALQQMLAADPSIYPEGLVTGKFGHLTEKAVKRFQAKHGFEQIGNVGPKTLVRLNELFKDKDRDREEGDDNDNENATSTAAKTGEFKILVCHKPNHEGGETLNIGLPALKAHLNHGDRVGACESASGATTTPATTTPPATDVTAPVLSGIIASSTGTTSTDVRWTTNENATGAVWYGTATPLSLSGEPNKSSSSLVSLHSFSLGNLATGTTYYFVVKSVDAAGNTATSSQQSFATPAQ